MTMFPTRPRPSPAPATRPSSIPPLSVSRCFLRYMLICTVKRIESNPLCEPPLTAHLLACMVMLMHLSQRGGLGEFPVDIMCVLVDHAVHVASGSWLAPPSSAADLVLYHSFSLSSGLTESIGARSNHTPIFGYLALILVQCSIPHIIRSLAHFICIPFTCIVTNKHTHRYIFGRLSNTQQYTVSPQSATDTPPPTGTTPCFRLNYLNRKF